MPRALIPLIVVVAVALSACQMSADETPASTQGSVAGVMEEEDSGVVSYPERVNLECPSAWYTPVDQLGYYVQNRFIQPYQAGAIVTSAGMVGWASLAEITSDDFDAFPPYKGMFCLEFVPWGSSREEVGVKDWREGVNTFPSRIGNIAAEDLIVEGVAGSPNSPWVHVVGRVIPDGYIFSKFGLPEWTSPATHLLFNVDTSEWHVFPLSVASSRANSVFRPALALTADGSGGVVLEMSQYNKTVEFFDPADNALVRFAGTGIDAVETGRLEVPVSMFDDFELHVSESASRAALLIHPKYGSGDPWRYILADFETGTVIDDTFALPGHVAGQITFSSDLHIAFIDAMPESALDSDWFRKGLLRPEKLVSRILFAYDLDMGVIWEKEVRVAASPFSTPTPLPGTARDTSGRGVFALTGELSIDEADLSDSEIKEIIERIENGENIPFGRQISFVTREGQEEDSHLGCDLSWGLPDNVVIAPWANTDGRQFQHHLMGVIPTATPQQFYVTCAVSIHSTGDEYDPQISSVVGYYAGLRTS
jgi:hypothetical protein